MRDYFQMLQVWKIIVPSDVCPSSKLRGWVLAETKQEARDLCGYANAVVQQEPDRLWIAKVRVIWEKDPITV